MKCQRCQSEVENLSNACYKCGELTKKPEKGTGSLIGGAYGCLLPIVWFVLLGSASSGGKAFMISFVVVSVLLVPLVISNNKNHEKSLFQEQGRTSFFRKHGVPSQCGQFTYFSGHPKLSGKQSLYLWIQQEYLNMLPVKEYTAKYQIPIKEIISFTTKGDLKLETEIEGNDSSIIGTMVAEELFGTAAAMRANQKIPKIINVDERKTIINARIDGENKFILFEKADVYNYLLENIPEKEISFVIDK